MIELWCSLVVELFPTALRECSWDVLRPPYTKELIEMARSRYRVILEGKPHFITCTTVNWLSLFSSQPIAQMILDSLSYLQKHKRIELYAYVIMENHLHMIASSSRLSREIGSFKSFTARRIIDFLTSKEAWHILKLLNYHKLKHKKDRSYQVWQEGSHPQLISSDEMMVQKMEYIHYNPIKCGYVDKPEHWRYSSARNYAGLEGLLKVQTGF